MIELDRIYEASESQYSFSSSYMVNAGDLTIRGMPQELISCQFELPAGSYVDGSGFVNLASPKSGYEAFDDMVFEKTDKHGQYTSGGSTFVLRTLKVDRDASDGD